MSKPSHLPVILLHVERIRIISLVLLLWRWRVRCYQTGAFINTRWVVHVWDFVLLLSRSHLMWLLFVRSSHHQNDGADERDPLLIPMWHVKTNLCPQNYEWMKNQKQYSKIKSNGSFLLIPLRRSWAARLPARRSQFGMRRSTTKTLPFVS